MPRPNDWLANRLEKLLFEYLVIATSSTFGGVVAAQFGGAQDFISSTMCPSNFSNDTADQRLGFLV